MRQFKKISGLIFLAGMLVFLSGCTLTIGGGASTAKGADGGVWKSLDGGKTFSQISAVATTGVKKASIAGVSVIRMIFDPQDSQTIYLSTETNGIVYTYDGGNSWAQFAKLNSGQVKSVAVDYQYKCTLYAVSANKLYKSIDCGRDWTNIYFHPKNDVIFSDVIIDFKNGGIIYLATSDGQILKSANSGRSWKIAYNLKNGKFIDLFMDPRNDQIIYAATEKNGLYKTTDSGATWLSLADSLKLFSGSKEYRSLVIDRATENGLILLSKYGVLRTKDGGQIWEVITLLPDKKASLVYSAAVNPKNSREIYYATDMSLVKSTDGGISWSSQKLPFNRIATQILVDPKDPSVVYLGSHSIK